MKIRKAKKGDLKTGAEIFRKESAKGPYNQKYTSQTVMKRVKDMFVYGAIYIAIIDNQIVGFISIAGGASLEMIEGKKLPALSILENL